jgi:ferredoxin-thioredoxin reductase catalytic subunit
MSVAERFSEQALKTCERLRQEAEAGGYRLNPDKNFVLRLIEGLLENQRRYGYFCCPCRLAFGEKDKDVDVICPCYYRDSDIEEFGACYCALYVSDAWIAGEKMHGSIPERRPAKFMRDGFSETPAAAQSPTPGPQSLSYPVWRCKVCGYLCARTEPPGKCPICKAGKDRFERFM